MAVHTSPDVTEETIRQRIAAVSLAIDALPPECSLAAFLLDMRSAYEITLRYARLPRLEGVLAKAGLDAHRQGRTPMFVALSDLTVALVGMTNDDANRLGGE